ncbi:MAG: hypothetical protein IJ848_03735 [Alphaproteobacteria bacterium]|nr:hypothetical protein [Alphaproteobacteria bacterium]
MFFNELYINDICIFDKVFQQQLLCSMIQGNISDFQYNYSDIITIEQSNKIASIVLNTMRNIQNDVTQIVNKITTQLNSYIDEIKLIISQLKNLIINYLCMYYNFNTDNVFINNTMRSLIHLQNQINHHN